MSTTLPTDATKANCDAGTDDPKLAILTDLAGLVDKFNLLKAALGALAQMGVGNGLELEVSGGSVADLLRLASKETALAVTTTLTAAHRGRFLSCTTTMTLNLTAAGTLGDGWFCFVRNAGSGTVTIDPSTSETVNATATLALAAGESAILFCNGAAFKTVGYSPALTSAQVVTALGYTPSANTHNHSGVYVATNNGALTIGSIAMLTSAAAGSFSAGASYSGLYMFNASLNTGSGGLGYGDATFTAVAGTWVAMTSTNGLQGYPFTIFQRIA